MEDRIALEKLYGAPIYDPLPVVLVKGEGCYLWDNHGKKYLDMHSAYSAVSLGHKHPRLLKVFEEQTEKLTLCSRSFYNEFLGPFLERLCEITGFPKAIPMNSGTEAVETAIKAARRWGYRIKGIPENKAEIIVCDYNFHGRTTTIVGFSSKPVSRKDFGPPTPGFISIPFGNPRALEEAITDNTCAFLLEPFQGEGGMNFPPPGYHREIEAICRKHNVLLLFDEVQTGFGRTGKLFAFQHENIHPDGLILGKALSAGYYPVSAFVAHEEIMDLFEPGSHGSTFAGNPLAARIALESINAILDEKVTERSAELGDYFIEELKKVAHAPVKEIRGKGLWIGVEFEPAHIRAKDFTYRLMEHGVLSATRGEYIMSFAPPLTITREQIDYTVKQFAAILDEFNREQGAA